MTAPRDGFYWMRWRDDPWRVVEITGGMCLTPGSEEPWLLDADAERKGYKVGPRVIPPDLSFEIYGPGMAELAAAHAAMGQSSALLPDLDRATLATLGRVSPRIVEGPGIPELRAALAMLPPDVGQSSPEMQRWLRAARIVVGDGAASRQP